jgi:hypothetical protein
MTVLQLVHNDQTVTFETLGGDNSGDLCVIEGSRAITDAPTKGRVYDTFLALGGGADETAVAKFRAAVAVRLDRMAEHALVGQPAPVYLREEVTGESGARLARVFGITHAYQDGAFDWSLYRGRVVIAITIERDAVWVSEWTYSQLATSVSYGASAFERKAALVELGLTGGDQPGQVERLRLTAVNSNAPSLQEAFVGFKQRRGAQDLSNFSPRIDIGSTVNDIGVSGASLTDTLNNSAYWGGKALSVRFADPNLEVYERSFRARARCLFHLWNSVSGREYYEQYVGRYRVIGLVQFSDVSATYQMRAGTYNGAFYGSEPVSWLDDIYRVIDAGKSEFIDFGELVLPPAPSGSNPALYQLNPSFVFGAALIAGDDSAQLTLEQVWLLPADNYVHVKHRASIPYPQAIDIRGDSDGNAIAYVTSPAADGKEENRIFGDVITDVQASDGGFYFPHRSGSVAVVVANRTVSADMENRPRMRTYRG